MKPSSESMGTSLVAAFIVAALVWFVAGRGWLGLVFAIGAFPMVFANTIYKVACSPEGFVYSRFFIRLAVVQWASITEVQVFYPGSSKGYLQVRREHAKDVNIPTDTFSLEDLSRFSKLLQIRAPRARLDSWLTELEAKGRA